MALEAFDSGIFLLENCALLHSHKHSVLRQCFGTHIRKRVQRVQRVQCSQHRHHSSHSHHKCGHLRFGGNLRSVSFRLFPVFFQKVENRIETCFLFLRRSAVDGRVADFVTQTAVFVGDSVRSVNVVHCDRAPVPRKQGICALSYVQHGHRSDCGNADTFEVLQ